MTVRPQSAPSSTFDMAGKRAQVTGGTSGIEVSVGAWGLGAHPRAGAHSSRPASAAAAATLVGSR